MAEEKKAEVEETPEQKAARVSQQINSILDKEGLKLNISQIINIVPKS